MKKTLAGTTLITAVLLFFCGCLTIIFEEDSNDYTASEPAAAIEAQTVQEQSTATNLNSILEYDASIAAPAALPYRSSEMDQHVAGVPDHLVREMNTSPDESTLANLVEYLILGTTNDFQVVKRLHDWITLNIAYGSGGTQVPVSLLKQKYTTCGGYGKLFQAMAELAGLESEYIFGYSRTSRVLSSGEPDDHAWNAVKIDGLWYIVDCTHDKRLSYSGGTVGAPGEYSDTYLFISPEAKMHVNIAADPAQQHVAAPVTVEQGLALPQTNINFVRMGLSFYDDCERQFVKTIEYTSKSQINYDSVYSSGERIIIPIESPDNVSVLCKLYTTDLATRYDENVLAYREGNITYCVFTPPDEGTFRAEIKAMWEGVSGYHKSVFQFRLHAAKDGGAFQSTEVYDFNRLYRFYATDYLALEIIDSDCVLPDENGFYSITYRHRPDTTVFSNVYNNDGDKLNSSIYKDVIDEHTAKVYYQPQDDTPLNIQLRVRGPEDTSSRLGALLHVPSVQKKPEYLFNCLLRRPEFQENNLNLLDTNFTIRNSTDPYRLTIRTPADMELVCYVYDKSGKGVKNAVFTERSQNAFTFAISAPLDIATARVFIKTKVNGKTNLTRVLDFAMDFSEGNTAVRSTMAGSSEGYYKDIFIDSGFALKNWKTIYAVNALGLELENYMGGDIDIQNELIIGSELDANGILLYPDGEPRFRMIFIGGGGSGGHGDSLGSSGLERIRQFYENGGSYTGSCAGSYLAGRNVDDKPQPYRHYLNIFPYNTNSTDIIATRFDYSIPETSPLNEYSYFGTDKLVQGIMHNQGNWLDVSGEYGDKTEILALYRAPGYITDNQVSIWANKQTDQSGRAIMIGSHPESAKDGEQLELMKSVLLYALDGTGSVRIKGELKQGELRQMNASTTDNLPAFTGLGDLQYHHFTIDVPKNDLQSTITVNGKPGSRFRIFASKSGPAFKQNAEYQSDTPLNNEGVSGSAPAVLTAPLSAGKWYISIQCCNEVSSELISEMIDGKEIRYYRYYGDTEVLNGFGYSVKWDL